MKMVFSKAHGFVELEMIARVQWSERVFDGGGTSRVTECIDMKRRWSHILPWPILSIGVNVER